MIPKINLNKQNKILVISFLIFLAFSLVFSISHKENQTKAVDQVYADTFIPKGYVLIPVDLANFDTVSALINQFGVIDLFAGSPQSAGSIKIASRVKILRAPLNPNLFAVLVSESLSIDIMKRTGPFWAVVQNNLATEVKKENQKTVQIEYYKGG
jgi:hypothetical protein